VSARLTVGVLGCGHAAEMHLRALAHVPRCRVAALADEDAAAARRLATRVAGAVVVANAAALVAEPVDVIAILTPPASHAGLASAALAAGKDVVLERPVACEAADADDLAAGARAAGRRVLMAHNFRHHRHVEALRAALAAGRLGRVQALRTVGTSTHERGRRFAAYRRSRALGGGTLLDFGVAHFDLWRFLLRDEVAEVTAFSRDDDGDDVTSTVSGRMRSGALVTSLFGNRAAEDHAIEIFGEAGRAAAALYRTDGLRFGASGAFEGGLASRVDAAIGAVAAAPRALADRRLGGVYLASYVGLWDAVARTLGDGVPAVATLDAGRRALAIALAAVRSAREGRSVRVEDVGA
jgi:myo-inositol 2-dehydrogenase/D-chiro-inositol 1-dehydrogenase